MSSCYVILYRIALHPSRQLTFPFNEYPLITIPNRGINQIHDKAVRNPCSVSKSSLLATGLLANQHNQEIISFSYHSCSTRLQRKQQFCLIYSSQNGQQRKQGGVVGFVPDLLSHFCHVGNPFSTL